jgi:hypothetical protein
MVDRELAMIELKGDVNSLLRKGRTAIEYEVLWKEDI